jgi:acyl-lipid omega-6 desaturase (Delta-12 desaturase)
MNTREPTAATALQTVEHSADIRVGKELLNATAPFANDERATSWREVALTFLPLLVVLAAAGLAPWWWLQAPLSVLGALFIVRAFVTYHDYMHGTILRDSPAAKAVFHAYAVLGLAPASSWKKTHNYHHGHVGQVSALGIGAFPLMTLSMWKKASVAEHAWYRLERHPLTVLFGYFMIFFLSLCVLPLVHDPRKHLDAALSILAHGGLIALLWIAGGFDTAFYVVLLPMFLAGAFGSYLFFAQHSFKRMIVLSPQEWSYYRAALVSSSYLKLNRLLQWFTGNIGFHHIHHLNVRIPFYRLPDTMAAIPELQFPVTTTLAPREIAACFRASLWDETKQRMVSYREAAWADRLPIGG